MLCTTNNRIMKLRREVVQQLGFAKRESQKKITRPIWCEFDCEWIWLCKTGSWMTAPSMDYLVCPMYYQNWREIAWQIRGVSLVCIAVLTQLRRIR